MLSESSWPELQMHIENRVFLSGSGRLCCRTTVYIGVFDLFKVGIGPSSSTPGPMVAAARFRQDLADHADRWRSRNAPLRFMSAGAWSRYRQSL